MDGNCKEIIFIVFNLIDWSNFECNLNLCI